MKNIVTNKLIVYLASRYGTYAIQFITSLIIAGKLGPYYLGVYGFITLIINYFQQIHFGISNSFNVYYVQNRDDIKECNNYIWNSLILTSCLSIIVLFFFCYNYIIGIENVDKYGANKYIPCVCIIAILEYFLQFFVNLLRVKNKLNLVVVCQSLVVFLNFLCAFLFSGELLIYSLLAGNIIGDLVCILLTIYTGAIPPFRRIILNSYYQKRILRKGLYLFLYNSCFYFIIISIRTIISNNYSIDEFGLFTFSYTLAHAILLLLSSLSFMVFPKVLGKLSSHDISEVVDTINLLRQSYITSAHLLVYIALIFFPFLLFLIPKYEDSLTALNLIALTVLMNTNSYSYVELMISKNREKRLALLSFLALIANIMLSFVFVIIFKVSFSYVILSTMIIYYIFTFLVLLFAQRELGKVSIKFILLELLPVRLLIPYTSALIISLLKLECFIWIPLALFVLMNWKIKDRILNVVKILINRPSVVNL